MRTILLMLGLLFTPLQVKAELVKGNDAPEEIFLVIYPEGTALIRELRTARLIHGSNKILIHGVPREIEEGSIVLQATSPVHSAKFIEYSFQSDLISRESLLEGSIGLDVQLMPESGAGAPQSVRLLAVDGSEAVVKTLTGIHAVDAKRIAFHKIPYRLTQHPLMTLKIHSDMASSLNYEISYLAYGLSWDSSYTIIVSEDASKMDISTWIHIHNAAGVQFTKANVMIAEGNREDQIVSYKLGRAVTLPDLSSKNVEWFAERNVPTTKSYRLYSTAKVQNNEEGIVMKPQAEVWLSVQNKVTNGLGQSLPAGVIKVFQKTHEHHLNYLGENQTKAITPGEALSLRLGPSHDVKAEIKQTDFRRLSNQVVESGYSLTLTNTKDSALDVSFIQQFEGAWSILRETHKHTITNAKSAKWKISLPAGESGTIRFRARMNTE